MAMTFTEADREFDTDLDLHTDEFREHNYELLDDLRQSCPVARTTALEGTWLFTSYESVFDACALPDLFSSGPERTLMRPEMAAARVRLIPIEYDGPVVQQYRKLLLGALSPGAAKRKEPELRSIATELIDSFIETGRADLATDLFTPLPARWILRLCAFDESDWPQWVDWIHSMVHDMVSDPQRAADSMASIGGRVAEEITRRRSNLSDNDLLSNLITARIDGELLTDEELSGIVFLLLLGGMDTTAGLTGNAFLHIAADERLRSRLATADATTLDRATEEFLRHDTPTQGQPRVVTRDEIFHGRQLKAGDRVSLMYASANRDPNKFEDPNSIDFDRTSNQQIAFSLGPHRCLGSNFARVMFQVMITEVLRRLPDVHISGPVERIADAGDVYAVEHLPVSFTAGRKEGV
jgi:cytochrome P450